MDAMKEALQKLIDGIRDGSIKLEIEMNEGGDEDGDPVVELESQNGPGKSEVDSDKNEKAPTLKGPSPAMAELMDGEARGRAPIGLRERAIQKQKMK